MKRRFSLLSIQGKLFAIFGFILLLAALVVGTNTYAVLRMAQGNATLERTFKQLMASYDAMSLLQQFEGAERAYLISDDARYFEEMAEYSSRIDTMLREAMLKAEDRNTKTTIYKLQQMKWAHDDTLEMLAEAYNADDMDLYETAAEQAGMQIEDMYDLISLLIERDTTTLNRIDADNWRFQLIGIILNVATLILFIGLALLAALIISAQIFRPILMVNQAVASFRTGTFDSQHLATLSGRTDEIGALVRAFLTTADAISRRREALEEEAAEIRANLDS